MKLGEIYRHCVEQGMAADGRGKAELERLLAEASAEYDKLDDAEREFFDTERMTNPYADTRISVGDAELEVRSLITGVDIQVGEVLLADRLRERGEPIDLILAHHPEGLGLANLDQVMHMQADAWNRVGVPIGACDVLISNRSAEVRRRILPVNHYQAVDAARLLDLAFLSCHTPADNCVDAFVQRHLDECEPRTLDDVVKALREVPEYADAARKGCGPQIVQGSGSTRAGRIMVEMTGGTEGPVDVLDRLSAAGVDTIVGMHFSEDFRKRAEQVKMSLVVAGHISSDALGMNLVLDGIEAAGVKVICTSGISRVTRA